jgi:hypothetical protein
MAGVAGSIPAARTSCRVGGYGCNGLDGISDLDPGAAPGVSTNGDEADFDRRHKDPSSARQGTADNLSNTTSANDNAGMGEVRLAA